MLVNSHKVKNGKHFNVLSPSSTMSFISDTPWILQRKRHATNILFQIPRAKTVLQLQKGRKFKWFIRVYWKWATIFCLFLPWLQLKIAESYLNPPLFSTNVKTCWSWRRHSRHWIHFQSTLRLLGLISLIKTQYRYNEASLHQTNQENSMLKIN